MDRVVSEFRRLLTRGLRSIAARESKQLGVVEEDVARALGYTVWTIRAFRNRNGLPNPEVVKKLASICLERGGMDRQWLQSFFHHGGVMDQLQKSPDLPPIGKATLTPDLPGALTSLIDHAHTVDALVHQLEQVRTRLLTLYGAPGIGKTRIAIEVARHLYTVYQYAVVYVTLENIRVPAHVNADREESLREQLAITIAERLGVKRTRGQSVIASLKKMLQHRSQVLVLDNFDSVISAASLVTELLEAAPELQILITSRQVLKVRGEHQFEIHPLDIPELEALPTYESIERCASVQLLIVRAQQVKKDFAITPQNARVVAEICIRLDGMPLAIELVARDCALFGPADTLQRLKGGLLLSPAGHNKTLLPATMYSAIAWSYDRLTPEERMLFRRLAVFVSGCTYTAIEAVCFEDGDTISTLYTSVEALVSKSLLRHERGEHGVPRYRLLQPVREYALEVLSHHGEEARLWQRHAEHFLAHVEANEQNVWQPQAAVVYWVEQDIENIRTALHWYVACGDDTALLRMTGALSWFWCVNESLFHDAYDLAQRALARCDLLHDTIPSVVCAKALCGVGVLAWSRGEFADALGWLNQSLNLYTVCDDPWGMCVTTNYLGSILRDQGDFEQALSHFQHSLMICRQRNDPIGIAMQLDNLGDVAIYTGRYAEARRWCEQALAYRQAENDTWGVAGSILNLARIARDEGAYDLAAELAFQSLETYYSLNTVWDIPQSLEVLAAVAIAEGRLMRAALLLGAAEALRERHGYRLPPVDRAAYDQLVHTIHTRLGEQHFAMQWSSGRAMTQQQAIEAAQMLLPSRRYGLTPREQEVAAKIAAALSDIEIAEMLCMEERELKRCITSIRTKLECDSRDRIGVWALRTGLAEQTKEDNKRSPLMLPSPLENLTERMAHYIPVVNYIANYWSQIIRHRPQDQETLIGLPNPYLVPSDGVMFQEMYYWDSYFMALGVVGTAHEQLILDIVGNMAFLCERFGLIPNGSRYYFLSRSQPPFFTSLIWLAYEVKQRRGDGDVKAYLERMIRIAEREHEAVWMGTAQPHYRQVFNGLSRYFDINYLDSLAACESGWDHSTRCDGHWLDHVPVDLNTILYVREQDFARAADVLGQPARAAHWRARASARAEMIYQVMWDDERSFFFDYDWKHQRRNAHPSLAGFYPLWAGLVSDDHAARMVQAWLPQFEYAGGLVTTLDQGADCQWASPNGWAPLQWLVVTGFEHYGYLCEAKRIMQKWCDNCAAVFDATGTLWEKYNVVTVGTDPEDGLYGSVPGFGWSNAVFIDFVHRLKLLSAVAE